MPFWTTNSKDAVIELGSHLCGQPIVVTCDYFQVMGVLFRWIV
jgi:hypothetical protein